MGAEAGAGVFSTMGLFTFCTWGIVGAVNAASPKCFLNFALSFLRSAGLFSISSVIPPTSCPFASRIMCIVVAN